MKMKLWLLPGIVVVVSFAVGVLPSFVGGDIHTAARKGNLGRIKFLLKDSPELLNAQHNDHQLWTALHFAAYYGRKNVVEFLVRKGADLEAQEKMGATPLNLAVETNRRDIAVFLIAEGANVNAKNGGGWPALHRAVMKDDAQMTRLLLANGARVDMRDGFRQTPLYWAAKGGHKRLAELLLTYGAKVNIEGSLGPLHAAARSGQKEMVQFLLANGADPNARDERGRTPLSYALKGAERNCDEVTDILRSVGSAE